MWNASISTNHDDDADAISHHWLTRRRASVIISLCVVVGFICLIVIGRQLPLSDLTQRVTAFIEHLGPGGAIVFGVVFVIATLLLIPASIFCLAAGAAYGLFWGTLIVSLASSVTSACAFLIARYLARKTVARAAQQFPRFGAIDRALAKGGWKLVALLRVSPILPFGILNYLFGITPVRFWPYVFTSWIAMLPATFLFIYVGYLGRVGLMLAAGESIFDSPMHMAMLLLGMMGTLAFAIYTTQLARKELGRAIQVDENALSPDPHSPATTPLTLGMVGCILAAAALSAAASYVHLYGLPASLG